MSATGTWIIPARTLDNALAELREWKRATAQALADFRRWAVVGRSLDDQTAARLAHLERRLLAERLTVAVVGGRSRGKSELVNALFFASLGAPLLPSGEGRSTACVTEILWDPARAPSLRLLPIETRLGPRALREHIADADQWTEIALDPSQPRTLAAACEALCETRKASAEEAARLGIAAADGAETDIPRWRYAIVNLPHPLLADGLVVLDTPSREAMAAEPEIAVHRVPEAAAIVFVVAADTGLAEEDRDLWREQVAPVDGLDQSCYVALNKIDAAREGLQPGTQLLAEIERQAAQVAGALGIVPARIFPVSARLGLASKIADEREGLIRSRIYRLEQALARGMVRQRRIDHAAAVRAESRVAFAEARALTQSRLEFAGAQLAEMAAIEGKNQKLVDALSRKAAAERLRLEKARAVMMGLRTAYNRHLGELAHVLDPGQVREAGLRARAGVTGSRFSRDIGTALDAYFEGIRKRLAAAIETIAQARAMMVAAHRELSGEHGIAMADVGDFATERFLIEVGRLEELCARDFRRASLITQRQSTLGTRFLDTIALQVVHVFEIADREARTWLAGFMRPLEAQLQALQEQANTRIEGMGRIQSAGTDLLARRAELEALRAEVAQQLRMAEEHHRKLLALLEAPVPGA
jgi:hypothetical protein